jgi:hypothetical protein
LQPGRGAPDPEVRAATGAEVEIAVGILEEVAAWTSMQGLYAWPTGVFAEPDGEGQKRLHDDVVSGSLYLVWLGPTAVATFALRTGDQRYWPGCER